MAHFSELDKENIVLRTIVVHNDVLKDENGNEQEQLGVDFLTDLFPGTLWKQCSYNASVNGWRKIYPGVGARYSPEHDAFIPKSPYPSWVFDNATCSWRAPVPRPDDEDIKWTYKWSESEGWKKHIYDPVPE